MRIGRFTLAGQFYHHGGMMMAMQQNMAVLFVNIPKADYECYEFVAIGGMFDDVPYEAGKGEPPEYEVALLKLDDGAPSFIFNRV